MQSLGVPEPILSDWNCVIERCSGTPEAKLHTHTHLGVCRVHTVNSGRPIQFPRDALYFKGVAFDGDRIRHSRIFLECEVILAADVGNSPFRVLAFQDLKHQFSFLRAFVIR